MFRLLVTLAPADRFAVPDRVRNHLRAFAARFPAGAGEWTAIGQAVDNLPEPSALLGQLRNVFMLEAG